jgi:hypothetical protein
MLIFNKKGAEYKTKISQIGLGLVSMILPFNLSSMSDYSN